MAFQNHPTWTSSACSLLDVVATSGGHVPPIRVHTVNSGELRTPYPVPVCVTEKLWLVKFNGFILQLMAKTNHKFPITQTGTGYGIRSSPEFTVQCLSI